LRKLSLETTVLFSGPTTTSCSAIGREIHLKSVTYPKSIAGYEEENSFNIFHGPGHDMNVLRKNWHEHSSGYYSRIISNTSWNSECRISNPTDTEDPFFT
jgi:hypothetical protein